MTAYDDMDAGDLRAEAQLAEQNLEMLVDKLVAAVEEGDPMLIAGLTGAVKVVRNRQRGIRRRLRLEVA